MYSVLIEFTSAMVEVESSVVVVVTDCSGIIFFDMPDESLGRVQNNSANQGLNQVEGGNFKVDES